MLQGTTNIDTAAMLAKYADPDDSPAPSPATPAPDTPAGAATPPRASTDTAAASPGPPGPPAATPTPSHLAASVDVDSPGPPGHSPSASVGQLTPGRADTFDVDERLAGLDMSSHNLRSSTTLNSPERKLPTQSRTSMHIPTRQLALGADFEISAAEAKFEEFRTFEGSLPTGNQGNDEDPRLGEQPYSPPRIGRERAVEMQQRYDAAGRPLTPPQPKGLSKKEAALRASLDQSRSEIASLKVQLEETGKRTLLSSATEAHLYERHKTEVERLEQQRAALHATQMNEARMLLLQVSKRRSFRACL